MKKLLFIFVAVSLMSCSKEEEEKTISEGCNCVERLYFATEEDNFQTWTYFGIRPTEFNCAANGWSEIYRYYYSSSSYRWVKEKYIVHCE